VKRIIVAAAGAALAGLTACSSGVAPAAAPGNAPIPVSCTQKYQTWEHGQGAGLVPAIHAISVASTVGNAKVLTAALNKAKPDVARAARYPVPACADPAGYWDVLLMHVTAAAASTRSASSMLAAVQDVPKIYNRLAAELNALSTTD